MDRTKTYCDYIMAESFLSILFFITVIFNDTALFSLVFFIISALTLLFLSVFLFVRREESRTWIFLFFVAVIAGEALCAFLMWMGGGFLLLFGLAPLLLLIPLLALKSVYLFLGLGNYALKAVFLLMTIMFSVMLFMMFFRFTAMLDFYDEHITACSVISIFVLFCQVICAFKIKASSE